MRVFHANAAGLYAPDAPRRRAEQEHIAGKALDGEVFVECADDRLVRLRQNKILGAVGNGAAGRDGCETSSPSSTDDAVHTISVEVRATAAALCADALREHVDDRIEISPGQIAVTVRAANQLEEILFAPLFGRRHRNDLLREHVERLHRDDQPIELARANRPHQRGTFDQLIASRRKDPPFRLRGVLNLMPGPADALQGDRDGSRRPDLADEIDGSDIDAKFERSGGDNRLQLAAFQPFFRHEPKLAGKTSMVREHGVLAKTVAEMMRHSFGEAARVHEHQRRPVFLDERWSAGRKSPATSRWTRQVRAHRSGPRPRDPSRGDGRD